MTQKPAFGGILSCWFENYLRAGKLPPGIRLCSSYATCLNQAQVCKSRARYCTEVACFRILLGSAISFYFAAPFESVVA